MSPARADRLSGGPASPDQRGPYQTDRDRLLYSTPFRRLAGVTQVVSPAEGEIFHSRLTHTLKVAQIGLVVAGPGAKAARAARVGRGAGHDPVGRPPGGVDVERLADGDHLAVQRQAQRAGRR